MRLLTCCQTFERGSRGLSVFTLTRCRLTRLRSSRLSSGGCSWCIMLDQLPRPLCNATLHFLSAPNLIRFQRCSHSCHLLLFDSAGINQLLRHYFDLSAKQITSLQPLSPATVQRLLAPLASLERQLDHRHPWRPHRALLIHALCTSNLTAAELALPHGPPPPPVSLKQPTAYLGWTLPPDPCELTLACMGLARVQLWWHAPFWRRGWAQLTYLFGGTSTDGTTIHAQAGEREATCRELDKRVQWIGCTQPDPATIRVFGYLYGHVTYHTHNIPATFSRPSTAMSFAYSATSEEECQRTKKLARGEGDRELPVMSFELFGGGGIVNGQQLRVFESLHAFLASQAANEGQGVRQQVQHFLKDARSMSCIDYQQEVGEGDVVIDADNSVAVEQFQGLPLYLSCFPMPDSIVWNN